MKINLTDYISTFAAFDPEYNAINVSNPLIKAKNCYKKTKEFTASLEPYYKQFPELKVIKTTLEDLNELFANLAAVETKGMLQLYDNLNLSIAQSKVKLSHVLAKSILADEEKYDKFIDSLQTLISEVENQTKKSKIPQLDEKKNLDAVDIELLTNSRTSLGFQDKFFGGRVNINAKTERSNISLFANGDFNHLASKPEEIKGQDSLQKIITMLQAFIDRTESVEYKFGLNSEKSQNTLTKL